MINSSDFILENDIYKNCILKKYVGTDAEVVVPETVQKIGSGAFA